MTTRRLNIPSPQHSASARKIALAARVLAQRHSEAMSEAAKRVTRYLQIVSLVNHVQNGDLGAAIQTITSFSDADRAVVGQTIDVMKALYEEFKDEKGTDLVISQRVVVKDGSLRIKNA